MTCGKCGCQSTDIKINQERDEYTGEATCCGCERKIKVSADEVAEVYYALEKAMMGKAV